ncbi:putative AP-5 complex subunit zeta-1 protein [Helianthus anomalus]
MLLPIIKCGYELCKSENSENLIARAYPQLGKIFQRFAILQFFNDYGEFVLHDVDPNLLTFFRSCLSR